MVLGIRRWPVALMLLAVALPAGCTRGVSSDEAAPASTEVERSTTTTDPPTTTTTERPTTITTAAPTTTTAAAPTTTTNPGSISADEFNQITTGMSYAQAVGIIGGDGELMSQVDIGGYNTVAYSWAGQGGLGANAILMFQNDALVSKAQFGLG